VFAAALLVDTLLRTTKPALEVVLPEWVLRAELGLTRRPSMPRDRAEVGVEYTVLPAALAVSRAVEEAAAELLLVPVEQVELVEPVE
jgi:hypothetical protein